MVAGAVLCVDLEAQISWQAQYFVDLSQLEPPSTTITSNTTITTVITTITMISTFITNVTSLDPNASRSLDFLLLHL